VTIPTATKFFVNDAIGITWRQPGEERYPLPANYRPLVVIDPESESDHERLRELLIDCGWVPDGDADSLDDILREFANPTPPRPDEPTGLGAVVEDERGELWVRDKTTTTVSHWKRARGGSRYRYADIAAVKVLSFGVEA
jgi:hypothetical protein